MDRAIADAARVLLGAAMDRDDVDDPVLPEGRHLTPSVAVAVDPFKFGTVYARDE